MEELAWYNLFAGRGLISMAPIRFLGYKLCYKTGIVPMKECGFEPERN